MKFPGSIRVHVKVQGLPDAVQTSLKCKSTPEKTVEYLNKLAKDKGIPATYSLATEEEYWAYRNSLKDTTV